MPECIALNVDCMEYMKTLPDKAFDLAVVDPPYGDGNGGSGANRFGGMFAASIAGEATRTHTHTHTHRRDRGTDSDSDLTNTNKTKNVTRTGGTWAAKYGKKS